MSSGVLDLRIALFKTIMIRLFSIIFCLALCSFHSMAWNFLTTNEFDGQNRNEVTAYTSLGYSTVNHTFGGLAGEYRHHFKDRWMAGGASEFQFGKQKFGIFATGGYRLPVWRFNFYFTGKAMYNRYNRSATNEWAANISARWEGSHFAVTIGETFISYNMLGSSYNEPLTFTFGVEGLLMPRRNGWNIGIFFRNYDDFYYENWNINWGLCFNARLMPKMTLVGQFDVRPAGSLSQIASRYETSGKIGIKYVW